ncbi:LacI family transcriptional regulator [Faecalicatena sp. AGMB00832]|uniref:LacI family transcriptional regulator n=1 Tax=Faecalicatena faecalis TaxID=2726362 RepID=A0ABS6D0S3_9FIRM|nr:LacI family DNA-binding transcriptional regulator [Faecalicatena faecalis]MBU3875085.1 LacI family transcriptional regulator [Faecalicatena faecalis]
MAATIKDIAKQTGLGLATISSYLNGGNVREKNRVKIEAAIEELHFEVNEVARGLKTNKTKIIGIIIPELNNIFCAEIITEVEDLLRSHGYATMICDCRTDERREEEAVEFLLHRRVDGLIIMPSGRSGKYLEKFTKAGKPVVLIDRKLKDIDCDSVLVDNEGAAEDAVNRLLKAGHTRIGMIAGPKDIYTAQERYSGYCKALEQAGIRPDAKLAAWGNYTIEGGADAMKELVRENPDMTAVFVSNYEMTMGAIIQINELGIRIPEELSFIGFDNVEFAKASIPKLSIVTQPTKEIARNVSELMLGRLEEAEEAERKEYETVRLTTSFVEGRSVL